MKLDTVLRISTARHKRDAVAGFPFDAQLLATSGLYRTSRKLYLKQGGAFRPNLVSAGRTLSSPILLENLIEYTPLESELVWTATDRHERKHPNRLQALSSFVSSLFHEQNHRILWKRVLPPAPRQTAQREARRRFLNLAESLVITADMALGDELGPARARDFKTVGVIYDPGTDVRRSIKDRRMYRNYLQTCLYATYLNLELFEPQLISDVVMASYATHLDPLLVKRAIARAASLNRGFITRTNLAWQRAHDRHVAAQLGRKGHRGLVLDGHPTNNVEQYKLGETGFDLIGL